MLCRTRFPKATVSLGWSTELDECVTRDMADSMAGLVKEYSLLQPVTFPVHGALLKLSLAELQRLLFQVPHSTLTVCGDAPLDDLLLVRKAFAVSQVVYDLPPDLSAAFRDRVYGTVRR